MTPVSLLLFCFQLWGADHSHGCRNTAVAGSFCSELKLVSCFFCLFQKGLFNIGNRLLVSIDLFLKARASIKLGHPPSQVATTILDHIPNHPGKHCVQLCVHQFSPTFVASEACLTVHLVFSVGFIVAFLFFFFFFFSPHLESGGGVPNSGASSEWLLGL